MHKNRKDEWAEFDELAELEIQPLSDQDLAAVAGGLGRELDSCSLSNCSGGDPNCNQ